MILDYIDDIGTPRSMFFSSKQLKEDPSLIDYTVDYLSYECCTDFVLSDPTIQEMMEQLNEVSKKLKESLERDRKATESLRQELNLFIHRAEVNE